MRTILLWIRSLPWSIPIMAAFWAPVAGLVGLRAHTQADSALGSLSIVGGAGNYAMMLGWIRYHWIAEYARMEWVAIGAAAVVLQNAATAILIRRHHNRSFAGAFSGFAVGYSLFAIACLGAVQLFLVTVFFGVRELLSGAAWAIATILVGYLASEFWLALPILAIEGNGLRDALRRSIHLSRRSRPTIFFRVAFLALTPAASVPTVLAFAFSDIPLAWWIFAFCVLFATLRATMLARLYAARVAARDGPPLDEVFS